MRIINEFIMHRCIQLARIGSGEVAPNPMVGAVLVYNGTIIGEGYHQKYGEAHAEVNCINSVPEEKKHLISQSILYVSLEPCTHFGKTPPCTDLIIAQKIPKVVIGSVDPFAAVAGKGIDRLRNAGVEVITGVCREDCESLNRRFFTFHQKKRPYIILKWAQSADGFIALPGPKPVKISNIYTDRLVHHWRSEEAGIMVGKNTALKDDPALTNRLWTGKSPVRMVIDKNLELPDHLKIFNNEVSTIIFNSLKTDKPACAEAPAGKQLNTEWIAISSPDFLQGVLKILYEKNILSVIVEGGAALIQSFIDSGLWDEARVITGEKILEDGLRTPVLKNFILDHTSQLEGDQIQLFEKENLIPLSQ